MYKSVDDKEDEIEGFKYVNKSGYEEYVKLGALSVDVIDGEDSVSMYYEDIPKLIKALQAAYDYKQGV